MFLDYLIIDYLLDYFFSWFLVDSFYAEMLQKYFMHIAVKTEFLSIGTCLKQKGLDIIHA